MAAAPPTPAPLAFEVASIKPAPAQQGPRRHVGLSQDEGRITISNMSMRNLLTQAYKVKDQQLIGPDWIDSERYDIVAKLPEGATKAQVPQMLQTLLKERFKVTVHKESKTMPVYAMVVAKGSPKLKTADADTGLNMRMSPVGRQLTGQATLDHVADVLSSSMDRSVLNLTGLTGVYDIDLTWTPDDTDRAGAKMAMIGPGPGGPRPEHPEDPKAAASADAPNIFIALQEKLGLKLEARKAPVDVIVVDSAEKIASEN